jgi:hypothetical protein
MTLRDSSPDTGWYQLDRDDIARAAVCSDNARLMATRSFPAALPHGSLKKLFDDIYFVTGSVRAPGPVPVVFSRNMTVVRQDESLTLINSLRLDDAGLAKLDVLGNVEHVIRIAGYHGMDDPFYKDRYGAKVWAMKDQVYAAGFNDNPTAADSYFQPDEEMTEDTELPISDAKIFHFKSANPIEGLVLLDREGGIIVSGDCLQHWSPNQYFNLVAKVMMRLMGFFKPHNVGPGWLKGAKPDVSEVKSILDLEFEHVLPVHGEAVIGNAKDLYRPAIDRL